MNKVMLIALAALTATPAIAQTVSHSLDAAYTMKVAPANLERIYNGKLGYVDQNQNPWRTISPGKWDREADAAGDDEVAPVPLDPATPVAPRAFTRGEQHEADDREADRDDGAPEQRPDRLQPGRAGARRAVAEPRAP